MRIITDVDEVCLQFSDAMQSFLATKGYTIRERMRDYHDIPGLFNITVTKTLEFIREFHRSPAMGQLPPEPCAAVVLPDLYRQGHRFVAISACLDEPEVVERRIRNLEEVFGFKWDAVHCVGLSLDKEAALRAYPASVWVEDMWKHAVTGAAIGHRTFLIDRMYNRNNEHPDVTRVHDWHEIAQRLSDIRE